MFFPNYFPVKIAMIEGNKAITYTVTQVVTYIFLCEKYWHEQGSLCPSQRSIIEISLPQKKVTLNFHIKNWKYKCRYKYIGTKKCTLCLQHSQLRRI